MQVLQGSNSMYYSKNDPMSKWFNLCLTSQNYEGELSSSFVNHDSHWTRSNDCQYLRLYQFQLNMGAMYLVIPVPASTIHYFLF